MTVICPYCFKVNDRISLTTLRQPGDPPGPEVFYHGLVEDPDPPTDGFYYCSGCFGLSKVDETGVLLPARFDEVPRKVVEFYFYEHMRRQLHNRRG